MIIIALILGFYLGTLSDKGVSWFAGYRKQSILWQRIIVSLVLGIIFYSTVEKFGLTRLGIAYLVLFTLLTLAAIIDMQWQIIPNKLIVAGILTGVLVVSPMGLTGMGTAAIGFLAGGLLMLVMLVLSLGRLGGGDIKLMAVIGLFVGWPQVLLVLFFSYMSGGLASIFWLIFKRKKFSDPIPMGPFIAFATVITVFWSPKLIAWYLMLYS